MTKREQMIQLRKSWASSGLHKVHDNLQPLATSNPKICKVRRPEGAACLSVTGHLSKLLTGKYSERVLSGNPALQLEDY